MVYENFESTSHYVLILQDCGQEPQLRVVGKFYKLSILDLIVLKLLESLNALNKISKIIIVLARWLYDISDLLEALLLVFVDRQDELDVLPVAVD